MAAATWRSLLRARVLEAEAACSQVPGKFDTALGRLMDYLHTGDAADGIARISAALAALRQASSDLACAIPRMRAAMKLEEMTSAVYYTAELPAAARKAVAEIKNASASALEAYKVIEYCRRHLLASGFLITCQRIPGVDGLIEEQRVAAIQDLENARSMALACAYHARGARDSIN